MAQRAGPGTYEPRPVHIIHRAVCVGSGSRAEPVLGRAQARPGDPGPGMTAIWNCFTHPRDEAQERTTLIQPIVHTFTAARMCRRRGRG